MDEEEVQLIKRSLFDDLEAWGEIVSRYKERVYGLALGIMKEPADADDVVQDAFIKAYNNLDSYDLNRDLQPWLFTIAANIAKNKLRRSNFRRQLRHPGWLPGRTVDDPAEQAGKEKREDRVRETLSQLPEKYRIPITLRYYGDFSYDRIAEVTDLPVGTVKTRLHRGKNKMKDALDGDNNGR